IKISEISGRGALLSAGSSASTSSFWTCHFLPCRIGVTGFGNGNGGKSGALVSSTGAEGRGAFDCRQKNPSVTVATRGALAPSGAFAGTGFGFGSSGAGVGPSFGAVSTLAASLAATFTSGAAGGMAWI